MLLLAMITGCSDLPMVDVPSENQSSRVQLLVLHFTSEHFAESLRLLTRPTDRPVSAHYLVPQPGDIHYGRDELVVHRLVPEDRRAWHAGISVWARRAALNDGAIGIEIVNRSACRDPEAWSDPAFAEAGGERTPEAQDCDFLPYPDQQIELVRATCLYVATKLGNLMDELVVIGGYQ